VEFLRSGPGVHSFSESGGSHPEKNIWIFLEIAHFGAFSFTSEKSQESQNLKGEVLGSATGYNSVPYLLSTSGLSST